MMEAVDFILTVTFAYAILDVICNFFGLNWIAALIVGAVLVVLLFVRLAHDRDEAYRRAMAIQTIKTMVCDVDAAHVEDVRTCRLTLDGETRVADLCATCRAGFVSVFKAVKPVNTAKRVKVVSVDEVKRRRTAR